MSWAAHELENYLPHKHLTVRVSYLAILVGCLAPDMLTKLPVYGIRLGSLVIRPDEPWDYHRGWPGAGFTHSLAFAVLLGLLALWLFRSREWAVGLCVGTAAHVLTDVFDSVGTMVFFPSTTQAGRYGDAAAYYGSLGLVWDLLWLALALAGFRALRARYFFREVVPSDPAWAWLRLRLSDRVLLACYRAYFVYGACRIVAWTLWTLWARLVEGAPMDWAWGGPYRVDKVTLEPTPLGELVVRTGAGATGLALAVWVLWLVVGRRLWRAAEPGGGTRVPAGEAVA